MFPMEVRQAVLLRPPQADVVEPAASVRRQQLHSTGKRRSHHHASSSSSVSSSMSDLRLPPSSSSSSHLRHPAPLYAHHHAAAASSPVAAAERWYDREQLLAVLDPAHPQLQRVRQSLPARLSLSLLVLRLSRADVDQPTIATVDGLLAEFDAAITITSRAALKQDAEPAAASPAASTASSASSSASASRSSSSSSSSSPAAFASPPPPRPTPLAPPHEAAGVVAALDPLGVAVFYSSTLKVEMPFAVSRFAHPRSIAHRLRLPSSVSFDQPLSTSPAAAVAQLQQHCAAVRDIPVIKQGLYHPLLYSLQLWIVSRCQDELERETLDAAVVTNALNFCLTIERTVHRTAADCAAISILKRQLVIAHCVAANDELLRSFLSQPLFSIRDAAKKTPTVTTQEPAALVSFLFALQRSKHNRRDFRSLAHSLPDAAAASSSTGTSSSSSQTGKGRGRGAAAGPSEDAHGGSSRKRRRTAVVKREAQGEEQR